jgi:hypothetical protein
MKRLFAKLFGVGRKQIPYRKPRRCRPGVESLECRLVPASVNASLSGGVLRINGTDLADTITVRQQKDTLSIDGLAGGYYIGQVSRIEIRALGGNDRIYLNTETSPGHQQILRPALIDTDAGNDTAIGGCGNDTILGGAGADHLCGHSGRDYIDGGADSDYLTGDGEDDEIYGDTGRDTVAGGPGRDRLVGGGDADTVLGGSGTDSLDGGAGLDYLDGEADLDYLYDDLGGISAVSPNDQRIYSHFAWFDMNTADAALRSLARLRYYEGARLDRADLLELFARASGGTVTANELNDLREFVANADALRLPEHVEVLANKVVNSDPANANYQGAALGDLQAGDGGDRLDKLVRKWFKGEDRPAAWNRLHTVEYDYAAASAPLFADGVAHTDIDQGGVGDCYLLAALAETAHHRPDLITSMFITNGDGTWTVRFFNNGVADYVTVDAFLPVNASGNFAYASAANELWVALAEKAYAQLNESGWIGQDGTNSYYGTPESGTDGINLGSGSLATRQITGMQTAWITVANGSADALADAYAAGQLVTFSSLDEDAPNPDVVMDHLYALVGYDAATQTFTLYNPHGETGSKPAVLQLTFAEIAANFYGWNWTV